jgi:hypothetical protein
VDLRARQGLSTRVVDGERVILDRESGQVHQLNSTASFVWDRVCDGAGPSEIAAELSRSFDVAHSQALRDAIRIVEEFIALRLLVQKSGEQG